MSTLNKTLYRALLVRLITASAGIGIGVCNANAQSFFRVQVEETDRTAVVHGLKKGAHPRPLVIVLHGFSASADSTRSSFGMDVIADREDFVVAYPDGFGRTWNYGIPIGKGEIKPQAGGKTVDDIAFLKALIERLAKTGQIDRSRIYLTGVSYGGMMAFAVACALSREIAAVAPLITGMSEQQRADCRPERALPMAVVAGTKDTVQTYSGENDGLTALLSLPATLEFWQKHNACVAESDVSIPHRDEADSTRTVLRHYSDCRDGVAMEFYRVDGGGHRLPSLGPPFRDDRGRDFETAEALWAFFKRFKLP